ncbi:hypothetical protein ACQ856_18240 [Mycolicibacterium psychrotolerans]|uniref:hypothetical protein n=1 Tax=Mycolicibacterium psychrotolerans TaxID=216929 RepID=UPI003D669CDC
MMSDHRPPDIELSQAERDLFNDLLRTDDVLSTSADRPCECACNGAEPHADRLCGRLTPAGFRRNTATDLIAMHLFGYCTDPASGGVQFPENVDETGNLCVYMCGRCADHAEAVTRRNVAQLWEMAAAQHLPHPECPACRREIRLATDLTKRRPI